MVKKSKTVTGKGKSDKISSKPRRKNTTESTRNATRQRSGNNGPQQGSH